MFPGSMTRRIFLLDLAPRHPSPLLRMQALSLDPASQYLVFTDIKNNVTRKITLPPPSLPPPSPPTCPQPSPPAVSVFCKLGCPLRVI